MNSYNTSDNINISYDDASNDNVHITSPPPSPSSTSSPYNTNTTTTTSNGMHNCIKHASNNHQAHPDGYDSSRIIQYHNSCCGLSYSEFLSMACVIYRRILMDRCRRLAIYSTAFSFGFYVVKSSFLRLITAKNPLLWPVRHVGRLVLERVVPHSVVLGVSSAAAACCVVGEEGLELKNGRVIRL